MIKKLLSTFLVLSMIISSSAVYAAGDISELSNVAQGKTYTSFNTADQFDDPSPLFDGNLTNLFEVLWDGNLNIGYIVDLGANYNVEAFRLYACPGRQDGRDKIVIEYAANPSGPWTRVYERTSAGSDAFGTQQSDCLTINNFGTAVCRYVKLQTVSYAIWSEFEILAALPIPKLVDTTYNHGVITTEFTENLEPSTVTSESFKVYADNVLLTETTDYTRTVSGKNVVITLNRDYYDVEFKIEATTAIGTGEYNLAEGVTDTVMAPPAVEITGFEILPPAGNNVVINATITNNTSDTSTSAVVFAFLLDENNIVKDSDMEPYDNIGAGESKTPQLTIDTSEISANYKVKAFLWKDLSQMQVWAHAQKLDLN